MRKRWSGIAVSPGVGMGKTLVYRENRLVCGSRTVEDPEAELKRYREAAAVFCELTEERARRVAEAAGTHQAEILRCQAVMLRDPYLSGQVKERILAGECGETALKEVSGLFIDAFSIAEDELTKQRAADVRDMRDGMLRLLMGLPEINFSSLKPGTVLLAEELPPSAVSSLNPQNVKGLVLKEGGTTAHSAILARALEIPAVLGVMGDLEAAADGEPVVVDGNRGLVLLSPSQEEQSAYEDELEKYLAMKEALKQFAGKETLTADGQRVLLAANIGLESDALRAAEFGCDGVGLFRSEFLFLERDALPDEEEQFRSYQRVIIAMDSRPVTIRTLDVGGDKSLPGIEPENEENPFLGRRGLRFSFQEKELFLVQLRAILRAAAFGKVDLMFPMVTSVEELREAKKLLEQAREQLRQRGIPYSETIRVGAMIETPSAALTADLLAEEADFFSIGTNDLTQYTLSVDRDNARVAYLYSYCHPAMLRSIRRVLECGKAAGIPVGMCGEAAADPKFIPVLLALGLEEFSVQPSSLLAVRSTLSLWTKEEAGVLTEEAFSLKTEAEVRVLLEEKKRVAKKNC